MPISSLTRLGFNLKDPGDSDNRSLTHRFLNIFKTWPKLYYIEASLRVGLVERTTFWGSVADLFACDLASELSHSKVRNLYNHSNTQGAPIRHIGGFLDEVGSDDGTLNAGWWLLPSHSDGAVAFHSAGARNSTVEWCSDL